MTPVAPRVGAWIETFPACSARTWSRTGRPSRGGVDRNCYLHRHLVARVGRPSRGGVDRNEAQGGVTTLCTVSPLAWGRGSKHCIDHLIAEVLVSPLAWGRGSKLGQPVTWEMGESPLAWGRGSKHLWTWLSPRPRGSPLAWGRGSKPVDQVPVVAPRVGAWIETQTNCGFCTLSTSRPSRGGVDRNIFGIEHSPANRVSPLAWGRGSKLPGLVPTARSTWSPLAWGRGSKRIKRRAGHFGTRVAPRVGAWIETSTGVCW